MLIDPADSENALNDLGGDEIQCPDTQIPDTPNGSTTPRTTTTYVPPPPGATGAMGPVGGTGSTGPLGPRGFNGTSGTDGLDGYYLSYLMIVLYNMQVKIQCYIQYNNLLCNISCYVIQE